MRNERKADAAFRFETVQEFIQAVDSTGLSTRALAKKIGAKSSDLRAYMRGARECPYPVQFAIESLRIVSD